MVVKKTKKRKTTKTNKKGKKKKAKKQATKIKRQYIDDDTFSPASLKKYMNTLTKMRKKKVGRKKKKIGLTNAISYLNLLYNAGKERKRQPRSNLLKAHPFKYPSMMPDYNVDNIWRATKLPKTKNKTKAITNLNEVYRQLGAFGLIKIPGRRIPKHMRGKVRISDKEQVNDPPVPLPKTPPQPAPQPAPQPPPRQLPRQPSREPPRQAPRELPSKPSRAPPPPRYSSDDDDEDSSSDDDE